MLRQDQIGMVIDSQMGSYFLKDIGLERDFLNDVPVVDSFATIITGVRRCGKSTLLYQLLNQKFKEALFFSFDDIRLAGFDLSDLARLHDEIVRRGKKILFFDEVQLVKGWEVLVSQLLREGYSVFITGSNASLLSNELGTHLTGRHLSVELFPFSFKEFSRLRGLDFNIDSVKSYLVSGGFPEFLKSKAGKVLNHLLDDILVRDITVRHAIRDSDSLKQLAIYLISNVGNLVSANKLVGLFGIKSTATILDYFSYFRDSYLMEFVPQFSYSLKVQARNPKKVYAIDMGLITEVATSYTDNMGHRLENMVYLHLRHTYKELFYYKEKGECDFVALKNGRVDKLVQVCLQIDDFNFEREYNGLLEAMKFFQAKEGLIITLDQRDLFEKDGLIVKLIPACEFMSQS